MTDKYMLLLHAVCHSLVISLIINSNWMSPLVHRVSLTMSNLINKIVLLISGTYLCLNFLKIEINQKCLFPEENSITARCS